MVNASQVLRCRLYKLRRSQSPGLTHVKIGPYDDKLYLFEGVKREREGSDTYIFFRNDAGVGWHKGRDRFLYQHAVLVFFTAQGVGAISPTPCDLVDPCAEINAITSKSLNVRIAQGVR